uniref:procollagen-proline 4-dioxygenase n=1 Tax=Gossypium raimondii TaxID=29730 RepID=A0A0D2NP78_GOSRA|nr:hypothetical protein B456_002G170800 [Gossypium raimondii]
MAKDKLEKSMVADNESGDSIESEVRTSSGMFLQKAQLKMIVVLFGIGLSFWDNYFPLMMYQISRVGLLITDLLLISSSAVLLFTGECVTALIILQFAPFSSLEFRSKCVLLNEVVADIEAGIAAWTFLPAENGESMQILHYENGQKYEPHFDYFHDKANQELGGHRIATVLMYFSDVESGGETVFPNVEGKLSQPKDDSWSDCAKNGYAVKPRKGDALLFFSLHLDATTDFDSLHGSCPVIKGEKWSATKWIHVRSFDTAKRQSVNRDCVDENENCANWASASECEKNPSYMIGSEDYYGYCRKSCKVCSS